MERIDIHNYEAYLLDLSEGNLSSDMQMELELFLMQHPELNIDVNELVLVSLEKEEISFAEKNNLKKSEPDLVPDTQFISYIENQLSHKEKLAIEKSCASNPSLALELSLYWQTIQKADAAVIYTDKVGLKRRSKIIWLDLSFTQYAAAACILFLVGLFILWPKFDATGLSPELAEHTRVNKSNPSLKSNPVPFREKISPVEKNNIPSAHLAQNVNGNEKQRIENNPSFSQQKSTPDTINLQGKESETIKVNESLLAANHLQTVANKTIVQVITENDEEPAESTLNKKKKGLWAFASKALNNLHKVGVKTVNGNEDKNQDKTSYALTLGNININHKASNL